MSQSRAIAYRADIDGLRAIAVLSVFLFHIDFSWVPGGYTGVDIFFVISGFLITRIIAKDIARDSFSLSWFYIRRIRRILPVFYTVTIVTMLVGAIVLLPQDLRDLLSSIRHAILFVANIYFSKDKGYFDISADEKPMLHIWSLSIEEQYYFIWPLLLLFLYTLGQTVFHQKKRLSQPTALMFTGILMVAGFVYAEHALVTKPGATKLYFVLQTRFSELMVGSLVALLPLYRNRMVLRIAAYVGGALVLIGMVTLSKDSLFPGFNALYPCIGAALLIYTGQIDGGRFTLIHRAFGLPVMAFIGLLSFSLYLWHWPILAFMRYVYGSYHLPWHWVVLAVVLTFALAFLSYRYVERNTKTAAFSFKQAFIGVFLAPAFLILSTTYALGMVRTDVELGVEISSYGEGWCHTTPGGSCKRGDLSKPSTMLMAGDSYTAMLNPFMNVVGRNEGWAADVVSSGACSPVFGFDETRLSLSLQQPCNDLKDFFKSEYKQYERILIASRWARHLGMAESSADPDYLGKLEQTLTTIAHTTPVYVFSSVPRLAMHPFRQAHLNELGLTFARHPTDEHHRANLVVKEIVDGIPNAHWIELAPAWRFFEQLGTHKGTPTYFDDRHLNVYGSRTLGELFVKSGERIIDR